MTHAPQPPSWSRSSPPIVAGFAPPGVVTLARLSDPGVLEALIPEVVGFLGGDRRAAVLTAVHYAVAAVTSVLTAPLVLDGMLLDVASDQLGLVLRGGELTGIWVGRTREVQASMPAARLAIAVAMLVPVLAACHGVVKVSTRGLDNVMLDALASGVRRHERMAGREPDPALIEELMRGTGRPAYRAARPLSVQVDAGDPVTFHVPRSCCVLATDAGPGACPTCPQRPDDDARRASVVDWVGDMDDDVFREVTGRSRLPAPRPPDQVGDHAPIRSEPDEPRRPGLVARLDCRGGSLGPAGPAGCRAAGPRGAPRRVRVVGRHARAL